jgi:uncharacterized membrane-anchored protein
VARKQRPRSTRASFWPLPRPEAAGAAGEAVSFRLRGRARVDARTKRLCRRLRRGEVALIDHPDLDATAAQALVELGPAAVVNAALCVTGRYPNRGPALLLEAGIPVLEGCGEHLLAAVREGEEVELRGPVLWARGVPVAEGTLLSPALLEARLEAARRNLGRELEAFARNTLEYLAREKDLAFTELPVPPLRVPMRGRPVLVVARGEGYERDLQWVLPFIRERRPVLVAVDGGADALLRSGHRPHVIVGDMDSASEEALRCGAELVVHTYHDGRASPGPARLEALGLTAHAVPYPGTSEDVALLLAHQAGAAVIVAVGTHSSMVEFLDKHRPGMASTLLTRLKVGSILVDAKGLSQLYRPALSPWLVLALFLAALLPVVVVTTTSEPMQRWLGLLRMAVEVWLRRHGLG